MADQEDKGLVAEYWQSYLHSLPGDVGDLSDEYQAWSFGNTPQMADELAKLLLDGIKTATASLAWSYEQEAEPYPVVSGYSVILDGKGCPIGIIQTTELAVVPFNEVDNDHAYQEGEGDRSLAIRTQSTGSSSPPNAKAWARRQPRKCPSCVKSSNSFIDERSSDA